MSLTGLPVALVQRQRRSQQRKCSPVVVHAAGKLLELCWGSLHDLSISAWAAAAGQHAALGVEESAALD